MEAATIAIRNRVMQSDEHKFEFDWTYEANHIKVCMKINVIYVALAFLAAGLLSLGVYLV